MVADAALPQPLFAPPRITAEAADSDGAIMLRSAQPLGDSCACAGVVSF
jgi:hypothetical protein